MIEGTFEYRVGNIVKDLIDEEEIKSAEELEKFLDKNKQALADALIYDIDVYMGMINFFEIVKNEKA